MTRRTVITAADLRADPSRLLNDPMAFIDRLEAAENTCLMFGWTSSHRREGFRHRAAYALWSKWLKMAGGSEFSFPRNHPHLSDDAVRPLVEEDEALERRTMERIGELVTTEPVG